MTTASQPLLDALPLAGVFTGTVLIVLVGIEAGFRIGRRRRERLDGTKEAPIGGAVGALLGLLAFLLAFTFGIAASRFDARRHLLLDEVNSIGTTYLRAGMLPEPQRSELRGLLKQYVDVRANLAAHPEELPAAIARSEELQSAIWQSATVVAQADPQSEVTALFVDSLNETIDLHTKRVVYGTQYRIPSVIWIVLGLVAVLSMLSMGYQFGLTGTRNLLISSVLGLSFSLVILLISDLDRGAEGNLRVNQQPLLELQQKLSQEGAGA
jgi:hypothetical protein